MIVQKYGGSSLASMQKMRAVANQIVVAKQNHHQIIVVVSAMGKTTNKLMALAQEASMNPSKRELDMLLSTGEQVSTALLSMILNEMGHQALSLNGFQAGIETVGLHTKNKIKDIDTSRIRRYLNEDYIVIITGFQGYNSDAGDITTLGRGGSDTSAVALAAKFQCACEIFTDVDGIHTIDPRRYKPSKKLETISYEELTELAFLGAHVMDSRAVEIAKKYQVPLRIAKTHRTGDGTWVKENDCMMEARKITGVSIKDDIMMMTLHRLNTPEKSVSHLFSTLAEKEINVDMISQTLIEDGIVSIAFTCDLSEISGVRASIDAMNHDYPGFLVTEDKFVSKVSVVGLGMRSQSGVAASMFALLSKENIPFKLVTTSDISISYTIPKSLTDKAVRLIAEQFGL